MRPVRVQGAGLMWKRPVLLSPLCLLSGGSYSLAYTLTYTHTRTHHAHSTTLVLLLYSTPHVSYASIVRVYSPFPFYFIWFRSSYLWAGIPKRLGNNKCLTYNITIVLRWVANLLLECSIYAMDIVLLSYTFVFSFVRSYKKKKILGSIIIEFNPYQNTWSHTHTHTKTHTRAQP